MLYYKSISILMHNVHGNSTPSNLLDLFTRVDSVHSYNTRSASAGKFYINYSRLKQQSHSFSRIGCKIWNLLPESLRTKNKTSFTKCLQDRLLKFLQHKETYVDIHTIIQKGQFFLYSIVYNLLFCLKCYHVKIDQTLADLFPLLVYLI